MPPPSPHSPRRTPVSAPASGARSRARTASVLARTRAPADASSSPSCSPIGDSRRSALSSRSSSRYSAREVNIRYGSPPIPRVTRSSIITPIYAWSRRRISAGSPRTLQRRIDPRDQPLRARLLVAGRPVDLPGEEQPAHQLGLERRRSAASGPRNRTRSRSRAALSRPARARRSTAPSRCCTSSGRLVDSPLG